MSKSQVIYYALIQSCFGLIYYPDKLHSPCNNRGSNGFCVPNRQCCSSFYYSRDEYVKGNCTGESLCCQNDVVCQGLLKL